MEDQQPAAGDLTDDDATVERPQPEVTEAESTSDAVVDDEGTAGDETDVGTTEDDDVEAEQPADGETEVKFRVRRPAGKRLAIATATAAALFVGAGAFAGAMVQPYLTDRATVDTKLRIASTAANAITTLWTYTPENIDTLADRAAQYLSGDFEAQYRKFVDQIAAPNKQAQITNHTQVTGAAVESLDPANATAIVYTNSTSTSPATKGIPSLKYLSYRVVMRRDHARWLVTKMTTITSLDLTPRV